VDPPKEKTLPLWLSVGLTVIAVLIVVGALGIAIDRSAAD
jgi:heme/copper-type cytochrome/quinol oxidase subunit 4